MTTILEAARAYVSRGWIIHPLTSPEDADQKTAGKAPMFKEWQARKQVTDSDMVKWFTNTDHYFKDCNIGLQCGKRSGVIDIDFDSLMFAEDVFGNVTINTLKSKRTEGREHVLFKYTDKLKAQKHHNLGIEILSDNSNSVLPPSIHKSGEVYHWNDPDAPIMEMPPEVIDNFNALFAREREVLRMIASSRPCFKKYWADDAKVKHGSTTRLFMGAFCSELFNKGATLEDIKMLAKILYQQDYKIERTEREFRGWTDKGFPPWGCSKLEEQCIGFTQCDTCQVKKKQREGKGRGTNGRSRAAIDLPPIPQEDIGDAPCKLPELLTVFHKWLHTEEDYNITAPTCALLANFVLGEPDIIGIIQPSGSNKTELLRSFGEKENQYIYPLSSITEHSFISGHKDNIDTVQVLRKRIVIIKDLTTMLSRKEDVRSAIFADMRELTDGYMHEEFGNGIKKEYHDIHSSILFGSTNAIERYYSMYSNLGARMMFIRPHNDPQKARRQSTKNQDVLKEMREELHASMMRFIKTALDDIRRVGLPEMPEDLIEHIGERCDFLAVARTTIHHNFKGIIDEVPEPEFPTRINNTVCRLARIHAFISGRAVGDKEDDAFALRIIADNIPTTRMVALRVLTEEWQTTSELSEAAQASTEATRNLLSELTALGVIDRKARESKEIGEDKRADSYRISCRWAPAIEQLRGVILRVKQCNEGNGKDENDINILSMNKKEYQKTVHIPLLTTNTTDITIPSRCPPSINMHAEPEHPNTTHADLQKVVDLAGREWEQMKGVSINSINITEFLMWYCEHKDQSKQPSDIKDHARKIFKLTPDTTKTKVLSQLCKDERHTECYGETCSCDCHVK